MAREHWAAQERTKPVTSWPDPGRADPLLVLSGSSFARLQLSRSASTLVGGAGFADVALDTRAALPKPTAGIAGGSAGVRAMADAMAVVSPAT